MTINWENGLFKLWIVISICWALIACIISPLFLTLSKPDLYDINLLYKALIPSCNCVFANKTDSVIEEILQRDVNALYAIKDYSSGQIIEATCSELLAKIPNEILSSEEARHLAKLRRTTQTLGKLTMSCAQKNYNYDLDMPDCKPNIYFQLNYKLHDYYFCPNIKGPNGILADIKNDMILDYIKLIFIIILPPLALLLFGKAVFWVLSGFKNKV